MSYSTLLALKGKEVVLLMESFTNFLSSVIASVIANYISKWVDRENKKYNNQHKSQRSHPLAFIFV